MKSTFNTRCRVCRRTIREGEEIYYDDNGTKHPKCRDRKERKLGKGWTQKRLTSTRVFELEDDTAEYLTQHLTQRAA